MTTTSWIVIDIGPRVGITIVMEGMFSAGGCAHDTLVRHIVGISVRGMPLLALKDVERLAISSPWCARRRRVRLPSSVRMDGNVVRENNGLVRSK